MLIHAIDSLPSHQLALTEPTVMMTADAGDLRPLSALGASVQSATDWRVAQVPGVDELCFVRRGSGGWQGVITVCEGHVATLGTLEQQQQTSLQPALFRETSIDRSAQVSTSPVDNQPMQAAVATSSPIWQRWLACFLLVVGLGLAVKSGSMMLEGARKYG